MFREAEQLWNSGPDGGDLKEGYDIESACDLHVHSLSDSFAFSWGLEVFIYARFPFFFLHKQSTLVKL